METALLTTKFYFPATRPGLVRRPRLVERLQAGLRGPLTLISAPAGSGKTTLVSDWRDGPGADHIAAGCSNKEIASQLVISVGTVKRHTTNIFHKLDARNRTEAVARARELELL